MRSIATDAVAWSVCVCVFLLVTFVSPAKATEPIEIPFWGDLRGPKEPCIRWGPGPPREGAFLGVVRPIEKHCESQLRCTQQKKSITTSARLLQPTALLMTGRCQVDF